LKDPVNKGRLLAKNSLRNQAVGCWRAFSRSIPTVFLLQTALVLASGSAPAAKAQQPPVATQPAGPARLPDAPSPHKAAILSFESGQSCQVKNTGATMAATGAMRALAASGLGVVPANAGTTPVETKLCVPHLPIVNWYARFLTGPQVMPFTPREKAQLAVHNLLDPFNLITILGEAGISVAANPHSSYGPGMPGYGRYVGVSFTQDMTGEFFDTFLIPSLAHQDPHYHRMPSASIKRRALHAVAQVFWTQGDNGKGMVNYGDLAGFAIDDEFSNLYVPGQSTRASATTTRYVIGLATAPIDNFVIEFLPDVARHIHIQVVIIQRVIDQVARTDGAEEP
jgi:hypothetical protein